MATKTPYNNAMNRSREAGRFWNGESLVATRLSLTLFDNYHPYIFTEELMRHIIISAAYISIAMIAAPAFSGQTITLFNEINEQTGKDNHMIAVQMFGDLSLIHI